MILRVKKIFRFFGDGKFGPDLEEFFGPLGRAPLYIYIYIYIYIYMGGALQGVFLRQKVRYE